MVPHNSFQTGSGYTNSAATSVLLIFLFGTPVIPNMIIRSETVPLSNSDVALETRRLSDRSSCIPNFGTFEYE